VCSSTKNKTKSVRRKAVSTVKKAQASKPERCIYSDPRHDQQVSLGPFGLPRTHGRAQETSRRPGRGRANSNKDLVTGPIRGFCALQVPWPRAS
jgi:hypothetical protein